VQNDVKNNCLAQLEVFHRISVSFYLLMPTVTEMVLGRPLERRNCFVVCMDRALLDQLHLCEELLQHLHLHVGGMQYIQNS